MDRKSVAETFKDGTVFITGSTGFLGKLLVEKLLRSCPIKSIAILLRSKRGFDADQRVTNMFAQSVFDRLREENPVFMKQIKIIDGDLEDPSLGISTSDCDWIIENVNFVFHCAATIKFNEPLEVATKINVQGTEILMALASKMKKLKGFVYVSTAYSHCPKNEIGEKNYPVPITSKELATLTTDTDNISSKVLKIWPNTYSFTKAVAENSVLINPNSLPVSVFRPSIIGCTNLEPRPGWLENMNGPSGIITGVVVGFLRSVSLDQNKITDIVPADYTVNALISVMWDTVHRYQDTDQANKEPKIYNYVSSVESPLTWGKFIKEMHSHYNDAPPMRSMWYIFYIFYTNLWVGLILTFLLHRIPATFIDVLLIVCRKSPKMLKMYAKAELMTSMLHRFTTSQWKFDNTNTQELWSSLSQKDSETFRFSLKDFVWKSYMKSFYYGIREHVLHEDLVNLPNALARNRKLFWLHHLCIALLVYFTLQMILMLGYTFI